MQSYCCRQWRWFILLCLIALGNALYAQGQKPAILFAMGVHSSYIVQPLVAQGFTVDTCSSEQLGERLTSGKYNVAVVSTLPDAARKALGAFLARGGGVFVCNPEGGTTVNPDRTKTNEWLAQWGAKPRWELYSRHRREKRRQGHAGLPALLERSPAAAGE